MLGSPDLLGEREGEREAINCCKIVWEVPTSTLSRGGGGKERLLLSSQPFLCAAAQTSVARETDISGSNRVESRGISESESFSISFFIASNLDADSKQVHLSSRFGLALNTSISSLSTRPTSFSSPFPLSAVECD